METAVSVFDSIVRITSEQLGVAEEEVERRQALWTIWEQTRLTRSS